MDPGSATFAGHGNRRGSTLRGRYDARLMRPETPAVPSALGRHWRDPRRPVLKAGALVEEHRIDGLVIGLPINMDGSEGPRCQSVRQFAANLLDRRDVPIAFWDERLSTAAVTRALIEADVSRRKRGQVVDKLAAAYILEGALAALRGTTA